MFKEITIKPSEKNVFDIGQIAESLLFYNKVNIVCNPSFFKNLLEHGEVDFFLELMSSGKINVKLEDNIFASERNNLIDNKTLLLRPRLVQTTNVSIQDRLERVIKNTTLRNGYSKRLAKKIIDNSEVYLHSNEVIQYVQQDMDDLPYLKRVISHTVNNFDHKLQINPEEVTASVRKLQDGFIIDTNIDFDLINKNIPIESQLTVQSLLFNIMDTRRDSMIASQMNSDLVTSPIINTLLKEKVNDIIQKTSKNLELIDNFSDVFLHEGKSIKYALNSGERSLKEYMSILEKADKFKGWLTNIDDDINLLAEYNKAVMSETWADKLPSKAFRWTLFSGIGLGIDFFGGGGGVAIFAGLAIGAGDTFLLDKILGGWKPNTFVDNELGGFLGKK